MGGETAGEAPGAVRGQRARGARGPGAPFSSRHPAPFHLLRSGSVILPLPCPADSSSSGLGFHVTFPPKGAPRPYPPPTPCPLRQSSFMSPCLQSSSSAVWAGARLDLSTSVS